MIKPVKITQSCLIATSVISLSETSLAKVEKPDNKAQMQLEKHAMKYISFQKKIDNSSNSDIIEKWKYKQAEILEKVRKMAEKESGKNLDIIVSHNTTDAGIRGADNPSTFKKTGSQIGCDKNNEVWRFNGVIYHGKNYFWMTVHYPDSISKGAFPNYTDREWGSNLHTTARNTFSPTKVCTSNFTVGSYSTNKYVCTTASFDFAELWYMSNTADYTLMKPKSAEGYLFGY